MGLTSTSAPVVPKTKEGREAARRFYARQRIAPPSEQVTTSSGASSLIAFALGWLFGFQMD